MGKGPSAGVKWWPRAAIIVAILTIQLAGIWVFLAAGDHTPARETRLLIILGATMILVTGLSIAECAGHRHASSEARLANDRLRLAMESGKAVAWDWDLKTGRDVWVGDLKTLFGLPATLYEGRVEDFRNRVHPDDRELVWRAVGHARKERTLYRATFRVVWPDGTVRLASATGQFYYAANGDAVRMLGIAHDVTEISDIEKELREGEERLRVIVEGASDAIIAVDEQQRIQVFNPAAEKMFRCRASDAIGAPLEQFLPDTSLAMAGPGLWGLRPDGSEFPIETSVSVADVGATKLYTVILRDVTERRRADDLLRESEERFRLAADTAPVMLWMSGPNKLCSYFNRARLEFTGRAREDELGSGWTDGVHPDDRKPVLDAYIQAFDRRESFQMEFRLRRHDGEYRWVLSTGSPRLLADGAFVGYIGSAIDITDLKLAKQALSGLSRKLMEAQEKERAWIARELHDDVAQRMALLTIELERLGQSPPRRAGELRIRIRELCARATDLDKDIQVISHRLHSSKLQFLGIVSAAGALCREMSEQHGVTIAFTHESVPEDLRQDVALALFRVLQEALTNAIKHAGVSHLSVALRGREDEIQLEIVDTGVGFDYRGVLGSHGLGLVSMQERLNLVQGEFTVDSRHGHGTRVNARVPLSAREALTVDALDNLSAL